MAVSCSECSLAEWDPGAKKHTAPAKCSSAQLTPAAPAWFQCLLPQLLSELDVTFCLTQLLSRPSLHVCRLRATTAQALLMI